MNALWNFKHNILQRIALSLKMIKAFQVHSKLKALYALELDKQFHVWFE